MKTLYSLAAGVLAISIAGCGGGSGGGTPTTAQPKAEGRYDGTLGDDYALVTVALENDEVWSLWGQTKSDGFYVGGLIQGQGHASNGNFTASNLKDFSVMPPQAFSMTATYVPGQRITGKFSFPGNGDAPIALTAVADSTYDYSAPAYLTDITGAWPMGVMDGYGYTEASMTVSTAGAVTGSTSSGCTFTGTVKPRASGKNVFDVNATFGAAPCVMPRQAVHGIAFIEKLNSTARELVVTVVDSNRSYGAVMFGARDLASVTSVDPKAKLLR
jgi:hypothetical protein